MCDTTMQGIVGGEKYRLESGFMDQKSRFGALSL